MKYFTFDKTDKGREEIASRKYHLSLKLRTLLLLFNGQRSIEEVLHEVTGTGLTGKNIAELLQSGFIQRCIVSPPASARADHQGPVIAASREQKKAASAPAQNATTEEMRLKALYNFYSDTIRSAVGLRGYALQLKVERARSATDFLMIRSDYLREVTRAQGKQVAHELDQQLMQLLPISISNTAK